MSIAPARRIAFECLQQVEAGGYASDLFHHRFGAADPRDTALAYEIVFGVLRHQQQLDWLIAHYSGRADPHVHPAVRHALCMGIYQLRYMDRVPPHAAVHESVELVKQSGKRGAAGFANAVLRKVTRDPVAWPDGAVALSHPAWLLDRWTRQFGAGAAAAIARANLAQPDTYIRIGPGDPPAPHTEPVGPPGCFRLLSGPSRGLRIQDIGSQSIVPLLRLEPGQRFLDLCASPGNKTAQALESGVRAVACDLHAHRFKPLRRLPVALVRLDGAGPLPFRRVFDRILIDAPCSGTGTLARNPEIKSKLDEADIGDLAARQKSLLANALQTLAPGGLAVYSTCSLEREENEDVVEAVAGPRVTETMRRIPGRDIGDGFFAAVIAG